MNSQSRKRVLLITSNFFPEESGIAIYSSDLAFNILSRVYDVTVLSGLPHYPWWKIPERYAHLVPGKSEVDDLKLVRISHLVPKKTGAVGRAQLELSFWWNGKKALGNLIDSHFDAVIAIMPTVACGLLARKVSRKLRIPGVVIFQDVASLGALQSGMPGAKFLYRIARFLEKKASRWATKIVVVSEEMERIVSKLTSKQSGIEVIHNYSVHEACNLSHVESKEKLKRYQNKFLIIHTGNIGFKQDLLNLVQVATLLEKELDIYFLIIGHGNQEEVLRQAINGKANIELMPFVSSEEYPTYLSAADILIINERESLREMSLPSKLTSYLTSGRPVIAAVSSQSATRKFLQDNALIVDPGQPLHLAKAILDLKQDSTHMKRLGMKGQAFAQENLSMVEGRKKYFNLIKNLLDS